MEKKAVRNATPTHPGLRQLLHLTGAAASLALALNGHLQHLGPATSPSIALNGHVAF